jgi:hypothetical protein
MNIFKKNKKGLIKKRPFWVLALSIFMILIVSTDFFYASSFFGERDSQNQQKFRIQREQSKKRNKLTLEFYGGYSTLNPSDLHTGAQYIENLYDWYYKDRYQYYSSRYSEYFHFTGSKTGEFQKIKNALPLGLRIKYYIRPRLAFSLGFQYISREETSHINYEYQVRSAIPDQSQFIEDYTRTLDLSPLLISVKGYTPLLGIHYEILMSRSLFVESYLTGGLLFTRFQFTGKETFAESNIYDYWEESIEEYDYKGSGIGYSLGTGVRAEWRALRNMGLFIEGGYTLQKAGRIYGPGTYDYCYTNSNAPQICEPTSSWEAYWGLSFVSASREWGEFSGGRLDAFRDKSDSSVNNFHLDLSGFQLRIGLSIRIR